MRIAYLVTQYPKVSHTFVRREILELERRGHSVLRLAIRHPGQDFGDPADREEELKTIHCLEQSFVRLVAATLRQLLRQPVNVAREFARAISAGFRNETGFIRQVSYVVEACFLLALLDRDQIEHLHAHFAGNSVSVARSIRRLGGPPYSFTAHGTDLFDSPLSIDIRRKLVEAKFAVAVSDYTCAQLLRWSRVEDWHKVHIVRCAVDDALFDRAAPISESTITLVCVGRLSPEKGQARLIEAFARVVHNGVNAKLVLVGDGEMRQFLVKQSDDLGIRDRVEITGFLSGEDVCSQMLNARAVIVPSFLEGLPVVIMEAFSVGRPVIASNVGGISELVHDGENGWLVAPGNVIELASAIQAALSVPVTELNNMGNCGRKLVEARHRLASEVQILEEFFKN